MDSSIRTILYPVERPMAACPLDQRPFKQKCNKSYKSGGHRLSVLPISPILSFEIYVWATFLLACEYQFRVLLKRPYIGAQITAYIGIRDKLGGIS